VEQEKEGKEETGAYLSTTDMPYKYPRINASEIDRELKIIIDAQNAKNNGLVAYIKDGELAFDTYENLFTVTSFNED